MEKPILIKVMLPTENGGVPAGIVLDYYLPITSISVVEKHNSDYFKIYVVAGALKTLHDKHDYFKDRSFLFAHASLFQILEERQARM